MSATLEDDLRRLFDVGDLTAVATLAVERYGPEVLGFLHATMRAESDADEAFAQACEDLWRGLPAFGWRSSLRAWTYTLARNSAHRFRRSPMQRAARRAGLSEISEIAERVRSRTLPHLRTEVKDRFAVLREALDPEDRELLVLRVDRGLEWIEIAEVLAPGEIDAELAAGAAPGPVALKRVSARLRKRFETLKDELRERARAAGLLGD